MNSPDLLLAKAEQFVDDLNQTIAAFTGEDHSLRALEIDDAISIQLPPEPGKQAFIPLTVNREPLLAIRPKYRCSWDRDKQYLAVESSTFEVFAWVQRTREQLFRVEYIRKPKSNDIPCSHIHVHAHRDIFTHLLGHSGEATRRARDRSNRPITKLGAPSVSEYHFPTGGPRFRPSFEDVLESLRIEFGLDSTREWEQHLSESRRNWRKIQTAAAIRDCPEVAIKVLRELGVEVSDPTEPLDEHRAKLEMN